MIPATYPSILDSSNRTKMLVYQVPSIVGLTRWIDYIPVKSPASESDLTLANTYANEGFILTSKVNDITGLVPFKDYVPIYLDSTATKAWSADNDGYIPMAELAGLLLNFTTGALDPRIDFTRATNATVTNSAGQITYAPHNLLTYSEQFDNAAWSKFNTTVSANLEVAPNGTTTMDKVIPSTGNLAHFVFTTAANTLPNTVTSSISVYAKSAGYKYIQFFLNDSISAARQIGVYDLDLGVCTATSGVTCSIESIGNGVYRCKATFTSGTTTSNAQIKVANAYVTSETVFAGDGTSGVYLWGAQLEIGSTATTYNSTTVKNLLGYSELFDNAAWTKSNSFVQTNLLTFSEDFTVAGWTKGNSSISANAVLAPNGYQTADKLIENTATSTHQIAQAYSSSSGKYVFSAYLKAAERTTAYLQLSDGATGSVYAIADLTAGTVTKTATGSWTNTDVSITPIGNGWYRVSAIGTQGAGATMFPAIALGSNTSGYTGDGTSGIYIWGAQLVQGAVAGDYRRTDAAALPVYYPNHNGVVCAEKLVENMANSSHYVSEGTFATSGTIATFSVYAKLGERNWLAMLPLAGGSNASVWFNLSTGVIGTMQSNAISASIISVGNGWYRCSMSWITTLAAQTLAMCATNADNVLNYTGDGTSGIYIFGAQLSDSASLDPYVLNAAAAPTAAAYYGPRFDYDPVTLAPKGLLIEEQRTNLLLNSSILGTALGTQLVTVTAVAHTLSFYGTGTVAITGTYTGSLVGSGAYPTRSTLTFTPTAGVITLTVTGTVQFAQLEAGAFATSYIPTAASQVTRAADVATIQGSNFYSWYNQNEGSFSTNFITEYTENSDTSRYVLALDNSTNKRVIYTSASAAASFDGATILSAVGDITGVNAKVVSAYNVTNRYIVSNNNAVSTGTVVSTYSYSSSLTIGSPLGLCGWIKLISYYPQRLSNDVLKGLTA